MYLHLFLVLFIAVTRLVSALTPLNLESYLQPDRITRQKFLTPSDRNQCARQCTAGQAPKICYYRWTAEDYVTLGPACGNCPVNVTACDAPQCVVANGYEKSIKTINRMVPGPSIHVCLGDRIIIDLHNKMEGSELSIHWHGVFQKGTQYMDGVPMVTQCGILAGDVFRYDFFANNEGTHYWHSHDGLQKLDGLQGYLVIRKPKSTNRNGNTYDVDVPEHTLMISDWMNTTAEERFPGLSQRLPGQLPITFLLDDRGRPKLAPGQQTVPPVPYKEVWVESGKRFRLRLVGGLCTVCGVQFSIEGHDLTLIATDGTPVNPVTVRSVVIYTGERYDVVLNANQNPGTYWIHMRGVAECSFPDEEVYQLAVLQYVGTNQERNDVPSYNGGFARGGTVMNPENTSCSNGSTGLCVTQLVNSDPVHWDILGQLPDVNYLLQFGFETFDSKSFFSGYDRYFVSPSRKLRSSTINNISFVAPPSPLLSQRADVKDDILCPTGTDVLPQCPGRKSYCTCVHVIKIKLGTLVQIILSDHTPTPGMNHPFHLHGQAFYVMDMGQYAEGQTAQELLNFLNSNVKRMSPAPTLKDTIAVPSGGYAVIKFRTNNPGYWFFHCHFVYHVETGMSVVLQVGETSDYPPVPDSFPKCGDFTPQVITT